eukprot:1189541-Amphidinium_carterae.1
MPRCQNCSNDEKVHTHATILTCPFFPNSTMRTRKLPLLVVRYPLRDSRHRRGRHQRHPQSTGQRGSESVRPNPCLSSLLLAVWDVFDSKHRARMTTPWCACRLKNCLAARPQSTSCLKFG